MKEFSILKAELLEKAKAKSARYDVREEIENAESESELLQIINENLGWCIENGLSLDDLKDFTPEILNAAGILNTGKENTGWANSGDRNSGYRNSGDRNSGYRNSGDRNSGDRNSGYRNSGNWNSGYRNSGDSNSGYRNSGAFCTDNNPKVFLFNRQSEMTVREWENTKACRLMWDHLNPNIWVSENIMTAEEKERFPFYETTGGYLKSISNHDMWANMWHNLSDESKKEFTSLPNFDAAIFEEITGIKI